MDGLRTGVVWIIWAVILGSTLYLIWAPKIVRGWLKTAMRVVGALLAIVFACVCYSDEGKIAVVISNKKNIDCNNHQLDYY